MLFARHQSDADREQFQRIAEKRYDHQIVGWGTKLFLGISALRRMLLFFHARGGTCLEVGAGMTARNATSRTTTDYCCRRPTVSCAGWVVLSDASDPMLARAKEKIQKQLGPHQHRTRLALLHADASQLGLPDSAFDTVIDTRSVCAKLR